MLLLQVFTLFWLILNIKKGSCENVSVVEFVVFAVVVVSISIKAVVVFLEDASKYLCC